MASLDKRETRWWSDPLVENLTTNLRDQLLTGKSGGWMLDV